MRTAVKKSVKPVRMTRAVRLKELRTFIQLCFATLEAPCDFKELANATGLSLATLYRLANGEATLLVRFGTVQALGLAAGLRLVEEEFSYRVAVVEK